MRFVSFCPSLNKLVIKCISNSENLYIVIITINITIFTLYIVIILFWLHVSFTVTQARSRKILEI